MSESKIHLPTLKEVQTGVFIADRQPSEDLFTDGYFLNVRDFEQAGVDAGKTRNYGAGVMRDIALQMVGINSGGWIERGTPEYELYWDIYRIMNNPDQIKNSSRNLLILGTDLVHDIWRVGENKIPNYGLPQFGKVGHKIISMLFQEEAEALREVQRLHLDTNSPS